MRCKTRTRGFVRPIQRTKAAVSSGESSSTKITSYSMPGSAASSKRSSGPTLPLSLKVGTTTASSNGGASIRLCASTMFAVTGALFLPIQSLHQRGARFQRQLQPEPDFARRVRIYDAARL